MKTIITSSDAQRVAVFQQALDENKLLFSVRLKHSKTEGDLIILVDKHSVERSSPIIWRYRGSIDELIKALKAIEE